MRQFSANNWGQTMKVILRQDVDSLGKQGEAHEVSPGYFRNFLEPKGLAVGATQGRLRSQSLRVSALSTKESREIDKTKDIAGRLEDLTLTFPVKVGDQGRMYGSITAKDIAEELAKQRDMKVDRHKIVLDEALRSTGEHTVTLKLSHGIDARIKVELVPEESS
jgi:large subunit ribosomal protein L9